MFENILKQVDNYSNLLSQYKNEALILREKLSKGNNNFIESKVIHNLEFKTKGKVLGVDSGFFDSAITGLDFCYIKSAGSYFDYDINLKNYSKLSTIPNYDFFISENILQKEEVQKFTSINRLRKELNLLYEGIKSKNPEYALIDGNVLPQPIDRPNNNSILYLEYENLLQDFVNLYDLTKSQDVVLIGTVEDSRANSFLKLVYKETKDINDILFLNFLLNDFEATSFFPIFNVESNIIYNDLQNYSNYSFLASYFKLPEDYPLRIELLNNNYSESKLKEIKGFISYISSFTKGYTYPSVLIDADKQAKLNQKEVNIIKNLVDSAITSKGLKYKRRERRI